MRVAIIGAGFAGLSAAKVLTEFGHEVVVYDKTPDVGGVWSSTRRYPGVATQNNKGTYCFSDFPMPKQYPEWPSGGQVQSYLDDYVRHFGLQSHLRLGNEVTNADLDRASGSWRLRARATDDGAAGTVSTEQYDFLVVANGIFSEPMVPDFEGLEAFTAAGGRLCHTSEFHDAQESAGRHVLVVGYGKSSCDMAVAISPVAASTTIVARELLWKMPTKLGTVLNYKYLMLTRMGEGLFEYIKPRGVERFLHGPGRAVRNLMIGSIQSIASRQTNLRKLGLLPSGNFQDIARSTASLTTTGLYEQVAAGRVVVERDTTISRLLVVDGRPSAELSSGKIVPADVVVCGTGFRQSVPFFDEALGSELHDERGNFQLYRQILPVGVPSLAFAGYNSSLLSPLSAEVAAWWIADHLNGTMVLPSVPEMTDHVQTRLKWMEERTGGKHARGTNIIPFSMHNIDEMISDLGLDVGSVTRAKQWLLPISPPAALSQAARQTATPSREDRCRAAIHTDRHVAVMPSDTHSDRRHHPCSAANALAACGAKVAV